MRAQIAEAINEWINNNEERHAEIDFLRYMSENAMGRENAKPIETVLNAISFPSSREAFQQEILAQFRKNGTFFIGWCSKGIFIVASVQDTRDAVEHYQNRIQSEQQNLENLRSTMQNYAVTL